MTKIILPPNRQNEPAEVGDTVIVNGMSEGTPAQKLKSLGYAMRSGKVIGITGNLYSVIFPDTTVLDFTSNSITLNN